MTEITIDMIIRSRRRTFSLEIARDARLILRVPRHASFDTIRDIVRKREAWIREKQEFARQKFSRVVPKRFVEGEGFLYLGETYPLQIVDDPDVPLSLTGSFRLSRTYRDRAASVFAGWYQEQARAKITERVAWYAARIAVRPDTVMLSGARKRWGSCNNKRRIRVNWRLVMAPLSVLDYVIVHELVHMEEPNHSARFWQKVHAILPEYRKEALWLKTNGHLLTASC